MHHFVAPNSLRQLHYPNKHIYRQLATDLQFTMYTATPSGYEYYRYTTKDSAKHPPYGHNSHYCTPPSTSLDAQQPRRHSRSISTSSYGHYSTSSPKSYNYYPPPYQSTEKYTPKRYSSKEIAQSLFNSLSILRHLHNVRALTNGSYVPTSTSSGPSNGKKSHWPTATSP